MPVLSGGYVHPSARKALQMLGHGRDAVEVFARDEASLVPLIVPLAIRSPALTVAPLLWMGVPVAVAYHLLFLSGFVLSGTATHMLVRGLVKIGELLT